MDSVALGKSHKLGFTFATVQWGGWQFSAAGTLVVCGWGRQAS